MANCVQCGKKFGFLEAGTNGFCAHCAYQVDANLIDLTQDGEVEAANDAEIDAILLTT